MHRATPLLSGLPEDAAKMLRKAFRTENLRKGARVVEQGGPAQDELILLSGVLVAHISDPDGRRVCTGLFAAPQVIMPYICRAADGVSRMTMEMLCDGAIARLNADKLQAMMVADPAIRAWGNGVLQNDLLSRAAREWALAALPAKERLDWFRAQYPAAEETFPHHWVAAYLGMTPVTFSRARNAT